MKYLKTFVCLSIVFGVLVALDIIFKQEILEEGAKFSIEVQSSKNVLFDKVSLIINTYDYWVDLFLLSIIVYEVDPRDGLDSVIVFQLTKSLVNFLKVVYSDPRPFWFDGEIYTLDCTTSFGNPSGHTAGATVTLLLCAHYTMRKKNWKYIIVSLLVFLVAMSRIYVGVHFISQVIYGGFLGLYIFLTYKYSAFRFVDSLNDLKGIIALHLLSFAYLALIWAMMLASNYNLDEEYASNLQGECGKTSFNGLEKHVVHAAAIFLCAGSALGFYLNRIGIWWGGLKIIRGLLVIGLLVLGYFSEDISLSYAPETIVDALIKYCLGFALFCIIPVLGNKCGLNRAKNSLLTS